MRKLHVKQTDPEIPVEVLASDVRAISAGIKRLRAGPMNDNALLLLVQHAAPKAGREKVLTQRDIRRVLDGIGLLEHTYLKKRKP